MLVKTAKAALAATILAGPALAEEHLFVFVGDGFFPEVAYAEPVDDIRLVNRHNVSATFQLNGEVEIYNDGDDISDDGYIVTLAPGEEVRFEADNAQIGEYEVIIYAISVNGGAAAEFPGVVTFDDEPDLGFGTGGYSGDASAALDDS